MLNFDYYNPTRIVFGEGSIARLNELVPANARVLVLYGGGSAERNGTLAEVELHEDRTFTGGWTLKHAARLPRPPGAGRAGRAAASVGALFLLDDDRAGGDDGGDRVLVDHLGDGVLEQHDVLVEGFDVALQLDAIDQVDRNRNMLAAQRVEERVL